MSLKNLFIREWAPLGALPVTIALVILIITPVIVALFVFLFGPEEMLVRGPAFALAGAIFSLGIGVMAKRHLDNANRK